MIFLISGINPDIILVIYNPSNHIYYILYVRFNIRWLGSTCTHPYPTSPTYFPTTHSTKSNMSINTWLIWSYIVYAVYIFFSINNINFHRGFRLDALFKIISTLPLLAFSPIHAHTPSPPTQHTHTHTHTPLPYYHSRFFPKIVTHKLLEIHN